ncbi:MAG: serine--tRNA ligase [Candidatus Babeliaceae bacterium]|nr:serine--tRNA ligase [Candidatus Babeliaceae bacterium]
MIDLALVRDNPEQFKKLLLKKDPAFPANHFIELEKNHAHLKREIEHLRSEKNRLAKEAQRGITPEIRQASQKTGAELKEKELLFQTLDHEFNELYLHCPNLPAEDIPEGNKESNKVIKIVGKQPTFTFEPKNHVELGKQLGWFDFEAAAAMTGSNFALYKGDAVRLLYSLTMMMLNNNVEHGFNPVLPPYLVTEQSLTNASNFPRFKDNVYKVAEDNLYLTPTAEVNITNLYRDTIFAAHELPQRVTAWTSCFRREAGTYGAHERGLIRIHQFEKVEVYTVCTPDQAQSEHERMVACAEAILQKLGLHYRISLLAGQDCSFASHKTYDIEVWMPGQKAYYEVSSSSNCTDFQARRTGIRFKKQPADKAQYAYTLNTSSLAVPRLMVALMETYQQENGSIVLPEALKNISIQF